MFKKDIYNLAEMEVIRFSAEDVITTSPGEDTPEDTTPDPDEGGWD